MGGGECCLGDEAVARGGTASSSSSRDGHSVTAADAGMRDHTGDFHTDATSSPSLSPFPPPPAPVPAAAAAAAADARCSAGASASAPPPPVATDPAPAADVASASALAPHACVGTDDRGSSEWEVVACPVPSAPPPLASELGSGMDSVATAAATPAAAAGVSQLGAVSAAAMDAGSLLDDSAGKEQQQQQHQEEEQAGEEDDVDDKDNREQGRAAEKRTCEEEEKEEAVAGAGGSGAAAAAHAPERAAAALPRSLSSVCGRWWRDLLAAAVADCSCYPDGPAAARAASAAAPAAAAAGWGCWGVEGAEEGLLVPVLVVGPAGSGKSTLVNAILRAASAAAAATAAAGGGSGGCFTPVEVLQAGLARSGSAAGGHGSVQAERVAPVPCRTRGLGVAFAHVYPAAAAAAAASFDRGGSWRSFCQQQSQQLRQIVLLDTPGVLALPPPLAAAGAPVSSGTDCAAPPSAPLLQPLVDSAAALQWQAAEASRLLSLWLREGLREGDAVSLAPPSQLVHPIPLVPQASLGTGAAADGTKSSSSGGGSSIAGSSGVAGRPLLKPEAAVLVVSAVDVLALAVAAGEGEGESSCATQKDVQQLQARGLKAYFDMLLLHYADVCPPVVLTRTHTLSDEQRARVHDYLASAWGVVPQLDLFEMPPPGASAEEKAEKAVVVLNEALKRGIGPQVYAVSFPVPGPAPAHRTTWRESAAAGAGRGATAHHHSPAHLADEVRQWLLDMAHELHPQLTAVLNDPAWQRAIRRSLMAAIAMTLVAIVLVVFALWSILSMLEPFSPFHHQQQQQHHRQNYYYRTRWGGGVGGNGSWPFW